MSSTTSSFLALSCVGFIASVPAHAAAAADAATAARAGAPQDRVAERDDVIVNGKREQPTAELESPKATAPLLDTPQTVTVISDQTLRKQNLQTLRDALQTIPGITFGAGEGGGGYGDSINLRGYSANNDITVDGIRDSAQYSRTDPFNLQQIEVYNGANSVFNGSGSVGGTINLVSKVPTPETLTIAQGAVGTDRYYRGAIDSNVRVSDLVAVRLNGAYHHNDVPGRDVEKFERWGIAPAVTIGMAGPTSLTIAYVHQEDRNTPAYGVPFYVNALYDGELPGVDRSDYFGIRNLDRQDTTVDRLTATFRHEVNEQLSVRNLTRWQRVGQNTVTSAPQGTYCLAATGRTPTGGACEAVFSNVVDLGGVYRPGTNSVTIPVARGFFQPNGPRGLVREQENQLLANQTDLRLETGERGGTRNVANVGVQVQVEDYAITTASLLRNAAGQALIAPPIEIANPNTMWTGPVNRTVTAQSTSETRNIAVYAFDTLELGRFFELNGGVRWEFQEARFRALPLQIVPPGSTQLTAAAQAPQVSREKLFSYRVGAVFHPVQDVSIYAGYGNAKTPSSATVRLGCGAASSAVVGGQNVSFDPCQVAPETARNYEAGIKAGLFGRRLEVTAAVFRNERTNFRVNSNDPALPTATQVLDGRSRVDGIALGLSGNVTPAWTIFANYTYLDGTVLQSVSDRCLAAPGNGTATNNPCGNSVAVPDPQRGTALLQTPEHSGSLFTTYKLPFGLEVGYGLTYQNDFALNAATLTAGQERAGEFLIHRAYLAYSFPNGLTAQVNVQNFTDERYFTGIRNATGWATPGDRRQAVLSLFYNF
ncbi:TonB-dependent receptor [Sphingomonas corticis]|jgi:catecholate siderophore receptor|uniref:TonB-dependent receptor n=1 Tax=Sphingomonas corticis TaxID=2722791 RepID=A0ABX1CIX0_9SPHN|nr:TonB-dependent receptor [Sphingomonas corticis]NJR77946.1 TonB-dependent receptor [Sphingomonas corticis]